MENEFYGEEEEEEFYSEDSICDLVDSDEINASEAGFMLGYIQPT